MPVELPEGLDQDIDLLGELSADHPILKRSVVSKKRFLVVALLSCILAGAGVGALFAKHFWTTPTEHATSSDSSESESTPDWELLVEQRLTSIAVEEAGARVAAGLNQWRGLGPLETTLQSDSPVGSRVNNRRSPGRRRAQSAEQVSDVRRLQERIERWVQDFELRDPYADTVTNESP